MGSDSKLIPPCDLWRRTKICTVARSAEPNPSLWPIVLRKMCAVTHSALADNGLWPVYSIAWNDIKSWIFQHIRCHIRNSFSLRIRGLGGWIHEKKNLRSKISWDRPLTRLSNLTRTCFSRSRAPKIPHNKDRETKMIGSWYYPNRDWGVSIFWRNSGKVLIKFRLNVNSNWKPDIRPNISLESHSKIKYFSELWNINIACKPLSLQMQWAKSGVLLWL